MLRRVAGAGAGTAANAAANGLDANGCGTMVLRGGDPEHGAALQVRRFICQKDPMVMINLTKSIMD